MNVHKQMHSSIFEIPDKFLRGYDCLDKVKPYINIFLTAKCLNDQVVAIKSIFLHAAENPEVLQFLSDIYFSCSINHPIRNQISKIFDKSNDVLTNYITNSIESLIHFSEENITCEYRNSTIVSISGCFQNFSQGKKSLKLSLTKFLIFLSTSLKNYLYKLSNENSSSLRNELYIFIHNAIRVIISCVQEFSDIIKLTLHQVQFLKNISKKLINSNDTPMDTKTNLGILIAYIARNCEDYYEHVNAVSKLINDPKEHYQHFCNCVGIISTFSIEDFKKHPNEIIIITNSISAAAQKYSNETNIYLAATRTLKHLSKFLLIFENIKKTDIENILEILLDYSLLYIGHDMDSIKHMCKDMLRNIVQSFKKFDLTAMMDSCFKSGVFIDCISTTCIVFSTIATVVDCQDILQKYPEIFKNLFEGNLKESKVNRLYEVLMVKSFKENDFLTWKTIWIDFLLNIYANENNTDTLNCIEFIFNKAVICDVQLIKIILNSNVRLSTKFSVLWTVRKNGLLKNFQNMLIEMRSNFELALISDCDDTKIMALRLLVETHKSTELITEIECEHILFFLIHNSNLQNPSIRSKALRLLIKLLVRLEVNLGRKFKEQHEKDYLLKFLKELLLLLSANLFPGANFSRKSVSLSLLIHTIQILIKHNLEICSYLPTNFTNIVFKILNDPYTANKSLAVEILNLIKTELILYESLTVIENLLVSVRPSDSLTAAYHLEHICNKLTLKETSTLFYINGEIPSIYSSYYCALIWCMNILKTGISIANKSILLTAKINPLYGSLNSIKHLLFKLNLKKISGDILWKSFLTELIDLCKISCDIVKPIVNNCSPEGHLPNDFTEYFEAALENEKKDDCSILTNKNDPEHLKITSQMVLLCAWRTVKEVCIILGEIVLRAPLKTTSTQLQFMLEYVQIFQIGELFKGLLLEAKHRGAVELAYIGFFKLCTLLWKVNHAEFNILPMKWLEDLINIILTDSIDDNKICATRRGGGIPFMVQALITSEFEVESTHALRFCMKKLFEICNEQSINNFIQKTHAFNILRTLYRCKELNSVIGEYIAEGVIVAIHGYNCLTWSEKNSATLLFSALIVRIFGVQETKDFDHINIKNKMTGRIFFLRHSKLYDFFLEKLKIANTLIEENKPVNNLQPILLILCRLYGTPLDGTDSNLKLNMFVPLLSKCSGSRDIHTRLLAAKAVASIVPIGMTTNQVLNILASYRFAIPEKRLQLNYVHGQLLQVKYLLINVQTLSSEIIENILNHLNYIENTISGNIVVLKTILDIRIDILDKIPEMMFWHKLRSPLIIPDSLSFYYPVFRQSVFIYNFHILRLQLSDSLLLCYLLNPLSTVEQISIEQTDAALVIIVLIIFKTSSQQNIIMDELEIFENEVKILKTLTFHSVEKLYMELISCDKIRILLNRIIKNSIYYPPKCIKKAYAILSKLGKCPFNLTEIILESKTQHEDIKTTMALCIESLITECTDIDENILYEIFDYLIDISQPSSPTLLRLRSSRILGHLSKKFNMYIEKKFRKISTAFACITLCLLMDEDSVVRRNVSNIILSINTIYHLPKITNIVPAYAQFMFIENIANTLKIYYHLKDNIFIKSFFMDIINFQLEIQKKANDINTEADIFDKNEENLFAETSKVILDCKEIYYKYFMEDI